MTGIGGKLSAGRPGRKPGLRLPGLLKLLGKLHDDKAIDNSDLYGGFFDSTTIGARS